MTYEKLTGIGYRRVATPALATQIGDNFEALWTERPTCRVYSDAALTVANDTWTPLEFTAERWDIGGIWSVGDPADLVAPRSGLYLVGIHVDWEADTTGLRSVRAGSHMDVEQTSDAGFCSQSFTTVVYLVEDQVVTVEVHQDSGSALDLNASNATTNRYSQDVSLLWLGGLDT